MQDLVGMIVKRAKLGKNFGTVIVPEGTIEFFPEIGKLIDEINDICADHEGADNLHEIACKKLTADSKTNFLFLPKSIQDQLLLDRDAHGNVAVS